MSRSRHALRLSIAAAGLTCLAAGCSALRMPSFASVSLVEELPAHQSSALLEAIRSSLSADSWRFNRGWSAEVEWEERTGPYPSPGNLRWSFGNVAEAAAEKTNLDSLRAPKAVDHGKSDVRTPKGTAPNKDLGSKTEVAKKDDAAAAGSDSSGDEVKSPNEGDDDGSIAWDGFWPLTVADLVHRKDRGEATSSKLAAATVDEGMRCLRRLAKTDNLMGWNAAIIWAQHDPQSGVEVAEVLGQLVVNPPVYVVETGERFSEVVAPPASPTPSAQSSKSAGDATHKPGDDSSPRPHRPTRKIAPAMQAAAAEAWCLVLAAGANSAIDGLAPAGRALERTNLPNSIRGELFRGVAAWVPPTHVPRLENALRQGEKKSRAPADIRQAAIDACLIYAINQERSAVGGRGVKMPAEPKSRAELWPSTIMNCRIDPDFLVRRSFIRWLGRARPEGAFELLKTQAESAELGLRQAALDSLGRLHTDAAHAELKSQADRTRDALRAAAVHALASWGVEEVAGFAHDRSQIVRIAVARELGHQATLDAAVLLTGLVVDSNVDVQLAAVEAVTPWSDDLAFPLLLHAMRDSSAKTRLAAFTHVGQRRKIDVDYRFDGPPNQRQAAVNAVAAAVGSSLSYMDQLLRREPRAVSQVDAIRATEIREHLAALTENPSDTPATVSAREWLRGIGPKDLPVVEAFVKEPTKASPEAIYREVLPRISPVYAALIDLESADVTVRRRGATTLANRGQAASLTRPILQRLQERLYRETDDLVWRSAMTAIGSDSTDECAEIANLALHHQSAEVRHMGCEYLGRHGQPAHAAWLLDLIEDRDRSVKLAAIRALGNCGNQVAVRGVKPDAAHRSSPNLRSLLSSSDAAVRFAAAVSLCRLGTPEGMQELIRLSYHANSDTREQAVKEMGLSGQTRFISHLITLGWTERNSQVRTAILESLELLVPEENRPRALGETPAPDAKIKCWVQWLQQRDGAAAKSLSPGAPVASQPHDG
jgi:HEAT repeat protein